MRNGGTIKLIEEGWFQKQIADFAYETALRKQNGEKPVIGVNSFVMNDEVHEIETHPYDPDTAERQIARTQRVRAERDNAKIAALLDAARRNGEGRRRRTSCRSRSSSWTTAPPWATSSRS